MASDDAGEAKGSPSRVVRLKLRYKSATVDEFIEKYALDVSPRGIHVNIAKPLPVGTLVKLEIRLASEQMVIKGAGRVVWTRDRAQGTSTQPAGLWIKFLQIDEPSKAFIETLASARADAGLAYEEHAEQEAENATVVGSPAPSHQQPPAPPIPAAPRLRATLVGMTAPAVPPARPRFPSLPPIPTPPPPKVASLPPPPAPSLPPPLAPSLPRLRATLVGIAAPMTSPPRTRMASLPPIPTPPPPKAASLRPPPAPAFEEQGEMDADEATVVWDDAPAPAALPAQLLRASLPPIPTPPPPKARSAPPLPVLAYDEQPEKDAEDVTVIFDHEPSHQEGSAAPVLVAPAPPVVATAQQRSARAGTKTVVTRRRSPWSYKLRQWGPMGAWVALGFFATVVLVLAVRSTDWFQALTTEASSPVVAEGGDIGRGAHDLRRHRAGAGPPHRGSSPGCGTGGDDDTRRGGRGAGAGSEARAGHSRNHSGTRGRPHGASQAETQARADDRRRVLKKLP